jgi:diguanylate cyclase
MDWSTVFQNSPLGMAVYDGRGCFVLSNRAYQALHGYSEEELRNTSVLDITHEADRNLTSARFAQLLSGELSEVKVEKRHYRRDGTMIWVNVTLAAIPGDNGPPQHLMGIVEDITERKRAEGRANGHGGSAVTPREREVLRLVAEGRSTRLIAEDLGISVKTVESHRTNIMRKLQLRSVTDMVLYAVRHGIIHL